jgi:hypothetical protein
MPNEATWRAQARTFGVYLGSRGLPADLLQRYGAAVADWDAQALRCDRWLTRIASMHPALTSLTDAYSRVARPYGDLRRRLTLMLALLESHAATHAVYDRARPSGRVTAWLALGGAAAVWGARLLLAIVLLAPVHLVANLARGSR